MSVRTVIIICSLSVFGHALSMCRFTPPDTLGTHYSKPAKTLTKSNNLLCHSTPDTNTLQFKVRVLGEGCNRPVKGARIKVWHADKTGEYQNPNPCQAQFEVDNDGTFVFNTILPGRHMIGGRPDRCRPRSLHFIVESDRHQVLVTQLYFAGDEYLGSKDPCQHCHSGLHELQLTPQQKSGNSSLFVKFDFVLKNKRHRPKHLHRGRRSWGNVYEGMLPERNVENILVHWPKISKVVYHPHARARPGRIGGGSKRSWWHFKPNDAEFQNQKKRSWGTFDPDVKEKRSWGQLNPATIGQKKSWGEINPDAIGQKRSWGQFNSDTVSQKRSWDQFNNDDMGQKRSWGKLNPGSWAQKRSWGQLDADDIGEKRSWGQFNNVGFGQKKSWAQFNNDGLGQKKSWGQFNNDGNGQKRSWGELNPGSWGQKRSWGELNPGSWGQKRRWGQLDADAMGQQKRSWGEFNPESVGQKRGWGQLNSEAMGQKRSWSQFDPNANVQKKSWDNFKHPMVSISEDTKLEQHDFDQTPLKKKSWSNFEGKNWYKRNNDDNLPAHPHAKKSWGSIDPTDNSAKKSALRLTDPMYDVDSYSSRELENRDIERKGKAAETADKKSWENLAPIDIQTRERDNFISPGEKRSWDFFDLKSLRNGREGLYRYHKKSSQVLDRNGIRKMPMKKSLTSMYDEPWQSSMENWNQDGNSRRSWGSFDVHHLHKRSVINSNLALDKNEIKVSDETVKAHNLQRSAKRSWNMFNP